MSDTAFTGGPWAVHPVNAWVCDAANLDERPICAMCRTGHGIDEDETYANARLIAAAPELYEALDSLLGSVGVDSCCYDAARYQQAATALAKARGDA